MWNKIFDAAKLHECGLNFIPDCECGEDAIFNVEYFQRCSSIRMVNELLYRYHYSGSSLVNKKRNNQAELHLMSFYARTQVIDSSHLGEYCDAHVYGILEYLRKDLSDDSGRNSWEKLAYGKRVFESREMQFLIDHASGEKDSSMFMKVLRTHNYYLYRLFQTLVKIKNRGSRP